MTEALAVRMLDQELEELRRPLVGYCYRMLGSPHEAEDAVQETMVRAWRALPGLADPSGLRAWAYKIATNVCIDALHDRRGRAMPMDLAVGSDGQGERGAPMPELTWVQPISSRLADDPLDRAVSRESIRDDGAGAAEPVDARLLERYIDAFERFDVDRIVSLLHRDAIVSMPPYAFWLRGREAFGRWLAGNGKGCEHARLVRTEANGGPAVAVYQRGDGGLLEPSAVHVLEWRDGKVSALHAFLDPGLFPLFGL